MSQSLEQLSARVPGSTPELMQWLTAQLAAGYAPATLQQSLLETGWAPSIAQAALHACAQSSSPPAASKSQRCAPGPDLAQHPNAIEVDGRSVQILLSMTQPQLLLFDNLLSDAECDQLIADARPALTRSRTVAHGNQDGEINPSRTSQGMFYQRGQTPVVERVEARIAQLLRWPVDHGEGLQILNYHPGAEYKPHHDYFDPDKEHNAAILQRGGQRVGTLVMYLNDLPAGGCTFFPESRLRIHPRKGQGVFFAYPRPEVQTRTLHGGDPVIDGEKWIATKWLREGVFH